MEFETECNAKDRFYSTCSSWPLQQIYRYMDGVSFGLQLSPLIPKSSLGFSSLSLKRIFGLLRLVGSGRPYHTCRWPRWAGLLPDTSVSGNLTRISDDFWKPLAPMPQPHGVSLTNCPYMIRTEEPRPSCIIRGQDAAPRFFSTRRT